MTCEKVAINGTNLKKLAPKKIKLAKVVAKEKKILARTLGHGIWYGLAGKEWCMVWPGGHGMIYGMAWQPWHGICYGLTGITRYMVWPGGH